MLDLRALLVFIFLFTDAVLWFGYASENDPLRLALIPGSGFYVALRK